MKAVVLLSGGLDSCVALAWAVEKQYQCQAISFDYRQKNQEAEFRAASQICDAYAIRHDLVRLDLGGVLNSSLVDKTLLVPKNREIDQTVPNTYVPGRNIFMLSVAFGAAQSVGADAVVIGAHDLDYSGYPDCRPEFFALFQEMADLGLGTHIKLLTPLIGKTKTEVLQLGLKLSAPVDITFSCYDPYFSPDGLYYPCEQCDACQIRSNAFEILSGDSHC